MTDAAPRPDAAYTLLRTDRFVARHIGPRRTDIDAITSVAPADLEITKDSSGVVISVMS